MKYFKFYLLLYLLVIGLLIYLHWWFLLAVIIFLGVVVGFIIMLAFGVEAGFRGKYPMDFLIHTNWINDYFYRKGFDIIDYDTKDSDNPQTILRKDNEIIIVRLNAPLTASTYFYEIITEGSNSLSLKFPVTENHDKILEELNKYFGYYPIIREQNPEMEFYGTTFSNNRPNTVEYQNDNSSFGELSGIFPSEKNGRNET